MARGRVTQAVKHRCHRLVAAVRFSLSGLAGPAQERENLLLLEVDVLVPGGGHGGRHLGGRPWVRRRCEPGQNLLDHPALADGLAYYAGRVRAQTADHRQQPLFGRFLP
jgi:hypothetical protein